MQLFGNESDEIETWRNARFRCVEKYVNEMDDNRL